VNLVASAVEILIHLNDGSTTPWVYDKNKAFTPSEWIVMHIGILGRSLIMQNTQNVSGHRFLAMSHVTR
jgi:hypothetical protein